MKFLKNLETPSEWASLYALATFVILGITYILTAYFGVLPNFLQAKYSLPSVLKLFTSTESYYNINFPLIHLLYLVPMIIFSSVYYPRLFKSYNQEDRKDNFSYSFWANGVSFGFVSGFLITLAVPGLFFGIPIAMTVIALIISVGNDKCESGALFTFPLAAVGSLWGCMLRTGTTDYIFLFELLIISVGIGLIINSIIPILKLTLKLLWRTIKFLSNFLGDSLENTILFFGFLFNSYHRWFSDKFLRNSLKKR